MDTLSIGKTIKVEFNEEVGPIGNIITFSEELLANNSPYYFIIKQGPPHYYAFRAESISLPGFFIMVRDTPFNKALSIRGYFFTRERHTEDDPEFAQRFKNMYDHFPYTIEVLDD
jgi:hypothetical protein